MPFKNNKDENDSFPMKWYLSVNNVSIHQVTKIGNEGLVGIELIIFKRQSEKEKDVLHNLL